MSQITPLDITNEEKYYDPTVAYKGFHKRTKYNTNTFNITIGPRLRKNNIPLELSFSPLFYMNNYMTVKKNHPLQNS